MSKGGRRQARVGREEGRRQLFCPCCCFTDRTAGMDRCEGGRVEPRAGEATGADGFTYHVFSPPHTF
jgi:hypothetical protein